jgi:hypothetical protein
MNVMDCTSAGARGFSRDMTGERSQKGFRLVISDRFNSRLRSGMGKIPTED